jgi:hypothetical protein
MVFSTVDMTAIFFESRVIPQTLFKKTTNNKIIKNDVVPSAWGGGLPFNLKNFSPQDFTVKPSSLKFRSCLSVPISPYLL